MQTEPWGVQVEVVEIKDVEIPEAMQRAMAREAEAERERRAKVISAHGELQASVERGCGQDVERGPASIQLRYLQTLLELGADQNSTVVFPIPIDIVKPFLDVMGPRPRHHPMRSPDRVPAPTRSPARRHLQPRGRCPASVLPSPVHPRRVTRHEQSDR